jgi:imidazolonepropionase-like amidohydrolase
MPEMGFGELAAATHAFVITTLTVVYRDSLREQLEFAVKACSVRAGLVPSEVLPAATSAPAEIFGLTDRGKLEMRRRADLP